MTYVDLRTHTSNKSSREVEKDGEACGSIVSTVPGHSIAG